MRKLGVSCVFLAFASLCVAQTWQQPFEAKLSAESYSGGYVLSWDSPDYKNITIYGPDAKAVYSQPLKADQRFYFDVWAVDSDGVMARAYTLREDHKGEGHIDVLDASGKLLRTINTGAYTTQHLAFAPDHTVWAVGYDMVYAGEYRSEARPEDFNVLHHYDRTGKELGEGVPWSKIAGGPNPETALQLCLGGKFLFAAADRIGFMAHLDYGHSTWIEASPDGSLLGEYKLSTDQVLG